MQVSSLVIRSILRPIRSLMLKCLTVMLRLVNPSLAVVQGPLTYNEDGLATRLNCDFIHEERFVRAYMAGKHTGSWGNEDIRWRAYVVAWAANKCIGLDGDFVECGVNRGGTAMIAATYVDFKNSGKTFYLLDTFQGLDERYVTQEEKALGALTLSANLYSECYEAVKDTFRDFRNVKIVRGSIPDTLSSVTTEKIAYLSIDMNCRIPEIAAAEYFWNRLVSGAVIVLDDYGWGGCHMSQKVAFDEFAQKHGVQVLSLPTGQGMIIKP